MSFFGISLVIVFTLYFFIYRSVVRRRAWRRKQKSYSQCPTVHSEAANKINKNSRKKRNSTDKTDAGGNDVELATSGFRSFFPKRLLGGRDSKKNKKKSDSLETPPNADNAVSDESAQTKPGENPTLESSPMIPDSGEDGKQTAESKPRLTMVKSASTAENGVETMVLPSSAAEKKTNRERRDFNFLANIRTALMLFVVALVFIFSFLPAWLMAVKIIDFHILIFYMHYLYNVANPVIYAFMNQSFRRELKRVFHRGTFFLRNSA